MNSISSTHRCYSKAVDDHDPVSTADPPGAYGGVGIFYRKDWNLKVVDLPDGGNIEVQASSPVLIIGVYLPSRKYVKKDSSTEDPMEYEAVLAQLKEILCTYEDTHNIFLCGDMNVSLVRRHGNPQDQLLSDFVSQLELVSYQDGSPTFFHENGKDKSEIDYILTKADSNLISEPTTVMQKDPVNLSDHTSLGITLMVSTKSSCSQRATVSVKPKWNTCNVGLYREAVRNNLRKSFGNKILRSNSMYDVHCQIRDLTTALKFATEY